MILLFIISFSVIDQIEAKYPPKALAGKVLLLYILLSLYYKKIESKFQLSIGARVRA